MTTLPSPRHARLLLVDDDEEACRLLAEVLEREAYEVVPALSADEALAKVEEAGPFDAVLTDLRMPEKSGLDLLKLLRERDPGALVLVLTAFGDATAAGEAIRAGAYDFISKPYDLAALRETLARTGKIGIARVVIRTRESLCAVIPQGDALLLLMMRYPQELVDVSDYNLPAGDAADYRVNAKELQMAEQLIASMESAWTPGDYKDEFRARLQDVIEQRVKAKGGKVPKMEEADIPEDATTNVVDFMSLLQ